MQSKYLKTISLIIKKLVRACTTNGMLQMYPTAMDEDGDELLRLRNGP
jgi:hypothetical protein